MDNYIGDDVSEDISADDAANILGALFRRKRGQKGGRRPAPQIYRKPPLPASAAQPNRAKLRSAVGFGSAIWVTTDGTDKVTTIEPQESFRGERLIVDVTAVGGTAAGLVLVRRIDIGTMPQTPSVEQPMPAAMFARDAVDAFLDLQIAYRSTKIQLTMGVTAAPGAGVTQTAAIGMFGEWIR